MSRLKSCGHFLVAASVCMLSILFATESQALPIYNAQPCSGSYPPCTIVPTYRNPTVDQFAGLTQQAFSDYFSQYAGGQTGIYSFSAFDSSPNYVIGQVFGPNSIVAQFIYHDGQIICCGTDIPFVIFQINNNDLLIGYNIYGNGPFLAEAGPNVDAPLPYPIVHGVQIGFDWTFSELDEENNILAIDPYGNRYELRVADEPGSLSLLVVWLNDLHRSASCQTPFGADHCQELGFADRVRASNGENLTFEPGSNRGERQFSQLVGCEFSWYR